GFYWLFLRSLPTGGLLETLVANTLYLIPFVVYEALMLQMRNGQTVGRRAMKIRVVKVAGTPLTAREAWIRTVVKVVVFQNVLSLINILSVFFNKRRRAIHDLAAQSRTISVRE